VLLACLALAPHTLPAAEETMRLRIEWGGAEQHWAGTVAVSQGTLCEARPLGIEADVPGSIWIENGRLIIRPPSARMYDGVDVLVSAPLDAQLLMELTAADDPARPKQIAIPLAKLVGAVHNEELDARGNRLLVRRAPGDRLRVRFLRDLLVFSAQQKADERFRFSIQPCLLPVATGTKVQITVELADAQTGQRLWSTAYEMRAGQPVDIPMEVLVPREEGVYELVITATYDRPWQQAVRRPLEWKKTETLARRKIQLLVLSDLQPLPAADQRRELVRVGEEIDPANPTWRDQLAKLPNPLKIPGLGQGPLGNDNMTTWQHPLGEFVRLNPSRQSPDASWEAYTLSIDRPGAPHILEVDYPSDVPQTLGISILEPNAAGALLPVGLDSGVDLEWDAIEDASPPRPLKHRLIFWPRTKHPMVLLTNLRDRWPAVYGKIRVLGGWDHLPRESAPAPPQQPERLLAAYFDRPLFPENFSADGSVGEANGRTLDDWRTFYQGGTRLVEYLHYAGYNALMISVLADGSTIYPSELLQSTPRYDTGVFLATAPDPVRKDVLEMLFRLFDREGLRMIPMVEFAAPLPVLEAELRTGDPAVAGLRWIGPEGVSWPQAHPTRRGLAPYYNVLDPRVQEAMLDVIRELAARYARDHRSFAGLAIRLSADGYAVLPGPEWGMDDVTIARFQRETGVEVAAAGPGRCAERAALLSNPSHRQTWLQWRADQLSRFYLRAEKELQAIQPGSRLFLAGAGMLTGDEIEDRLHPVLSRKTTVAETLLQAGIDVRHYQSEPGENAAAPVLLRPELIVGAGRLGAKAVALELNQMPDVDQCFGAVSTPGSLLFHRPQEVRVESFDKKSPFQPSHTWLVAHPTPSGRQNRRRFAHSLAALDCQVLADGGWMLSLGQEDSVRDLLAAYRLLPAVRFEKVVAGPGVAKPSQPVTFRYAAHAEQTYAYAVNEAPFPVTAWVRVDAPAGCRLQELTGRRRVTPLRRNADGTYWLVELEPYDVVAVALSEPTVVLSRPQVVFSPAVAEVYRQQIKELTARAASLRNPPPPLPVLGNAGFELPPKDTTEVPGWAVTRQLGVRIRCDAELPHGGQRSARLSTDGPWACLVGPAFEPPATGRLSMSVWLRVADAARQPTLWLALEGERHGKYYYRYAQVGEAPPGSDRAVPISAQWAEYIFKVDDLPLDGLSELRVRFDLKGPGEVWIDDVALFDRNFSTNENVQLAELITRAHIRLENGQISDCLRLLGGYWPRFLEANVPLPSAAGVSDGSVPPREEPARKADLMDHVRELLPEKLRF